MIFAAALPKLIEAHEAGIFPRFEFQLANASDNNGTILALEKPAMLW